MPTGVPTGEVHPPVGTGVKWYAGPGIPVPTKYHKADGTATSQAANPALAAAWQLTGAFNYPNDPGFIIRILP